MTIISKTHKGKNFELLNSLKFCFTNIQDLCSDLIDCDSFDESSLNFLVPLLYMRKSLKTTDSSNFSVRCYLPLIQKDSVTHTYGVAVCVKAKDLSLETSEDFYLYF